MRLSIPLLAACHLLPAQAQKRNPRRTFPCKHPTLLNPGFEWAIEGDANRNATVDVRFRR